MVSLEPVQVTRRSIDALSSPRISFSADFLDEKNFISITPKSPREKQLYNEAERDQKAARNGAEFEFLSSNLASQTMITADELFYEGKVLPFWQMHHAEKLNKISLKTENADEERVVKDQVEMNNKNNNKDECRMSWFLDDDPSPRPPKCTVLWKELLKLRKQRASTLSPSSSSSSSSSSLADIVPGDERKERPGSKEKHVKKIKKGLERTRSATIRIRPVINVPFCTQGKNSAFPPMLSLKKGRVLER